MSYKIGMAYIFVFIYSKPNRQRKLLSARSLRLIQTDLSVTVNLFYECELSESIISKLTTSIILRDKRDKETPFPIYLSLLIHSYTRKKALIDTLHSHGIVFSYYRLLQIFTDLANTVCSYYKEHHLAFLPRLKSGVSTKGGVDNIDHNTGSRSAKDSFHGTAIYNSNIQCSVLVGLPGNDRVF